MLNIIHETKDIIIVNKPAGQLSQGAKGFDLDLVSEVMTYNASQGKPAYAAIINRLDRPVSGLVLIAKNKSAAAKYSTLMQKEGGFNKQYEALICGKLSEPKGTFVDYLKKDGRTNTSAVVPSDAATNDKEAKLSKLEYEVISYDEVKDITHVRIHLITGRHHQISVQFASRRNPLVGDYKYATADCGMDNAVKAVALKRNHLPSCSFVAGITRHRQLPVFAKPIARRTELAAASPATRMILAFLARAAEPTGSSPISTPPAL